MYVFRRQVAVLQGIATLLATALVLWVTGTHMFMTAEASNLTYIKDTLSNSAPSETSNHTIQFLSPTGVTSGQTITVTFPVGFTIGSVAFGDIDLAENGVDETLVAAGPTVAQWSASFTGSVLTFTSGGASATIAPNATVTIEIGTNAAGGSNQITNPAGINSYEFTVTAGTADSGQYRVAIVDDVLVTANVDTTLTFTVSGVANGATVNTSGTTTSTTTTSDTLPFETLVPNVSKTLAQDLSVSTNARNGFVVTVEQSQQLQSSTGADIDGFVDSSWTTTPTAWTAPANNIANENTWGHWGLTSEDFVTGRTSEFSANTWVAASTTPTLIMGHTGPSDGVTLGQGLTRIGYQAQITALQEAGDDYNTSLTYIATPTF